eukprot:11021501-Alexandrium_andersonii.AAC.1
MPGSRPRIRVKQGSKPLAHFSQIGRFPFQHWPVRGTGDADPFHGEDLLRVLEVVGRAVLAEEEPGLPKLPVASTLCPATRVPEPPFVAKFEKAVAERYWESSQQ